MDSFVPGCDGWRPALMCRHISRLWSMSGQSPAWWIVRLLCISGSLLVQSAAVIAADQAGDPSLASKIDRLLLAEPSHLTAPQADDGLLLRRLSLDLRGVVPSGEELTAYIADNDPDKWQSWTRRFLADPLHEERMVDWYDKTFMQRRPFGQVDRAAWVTWLREVIGQRLPLDALVARMLSAPWWNNSDRPAQRFFLDREGDPHLITRDLGRVLLGRDMQCAQCHDHPLVDEYKQFDYHGLLAFFASSGLVDASTKDEKGAEKKFKMYVERPGADAPFESVFDKGVALRSGPRLPVSTEIFETYLAPDARLQSASPDGALAGVPNAPIQSRRQRLCQELVQKQPRLLARNFANRLWSLVFGRGLIHPLDMQHADNPASHPELLELLTTALIDCRFDVDRFLEQLVATDAYRRASDLPSPPWLMAEGPMAGVSTESAELAEIEQVARAAKERLAGQLAEAQQADARADQALQKSKAAWLAAQAERNAARSELDKAEASFNEAKKKSDQAATARDAAVKKHKEMLTRIELLDAAHEKLQQALVLIAAEDVELKQAIATSKARGDAARGALPGLEKAAADATTLASTELAALETPRAEISAKASALATRNEALAIVDKEYAEARQSWAEKHSHALLLEGSVANQEHLLAMTAALGQARAARDDRSAAEALLAKRRAEHRDWQQQQQESQSALASGEKQRAAIVAELTAAREAVNAHDAVLEQLRETVRQLEKAAPVVAMADALKAASGAIEETLSAKTIAGAPLAAAVAKGEQDLAAATQALDRLQKSYDNLAEAEQTARASVAAAEADLQGRSTALAEAITHARQSWDVVLADRRRAFAVSDMRPLSPEQLGLSILRVTGVLDNYVKAEMAELEKKQPLAADADAAAVAERQRQAVRQAIDKLRGNVDTFSNLYAAGVGQTADEFFASPDQALYMSNAGPVFSWSARSGQNVTERVFAQPDNRLASAELYGTLLARQPSPSEAAFVSEQLQNAGDQRSAVAQELVWSVLTSVEFRFYR